MSKTTIFARTRPDGTVVQVMEDGSEKPFSKTPMRPMTDAEWQAARKVPRAKIIRLALGMTQEEFATRFHIPLGTLRDWEQGRAEPDQPARAYLKVIASDAQAVQRALEMSPPQPR